MNRIAEAMCVQQDFAVALIRLVGIVNQIQKSAFDRVAIDHDLQVFVRH